MYCVVGWGNATGETTRSRVLLIRLVVVGMVDVVGELWRK